MPAILTLNKIIHIKQSMVSGTWEMLNKLAIIIIMTRQPNAFNSIS
jgi:hypothetical protein